MISFRNVLYSTYRFFKFTLCPIVLVMSVVPALRNRPYLVVATNTLVLFGVVGTLAWSESWLGVLTSIVLQAVGFGLALLFGISGPDLEKRMGERKAEVGNRLSGRRDLMIAIVLGVLLALALVVARIGDIAEERSGYPILVGIIFVGLAARHLYARRDRLLILLWIIWSFAFVLLYASALWPGRVLRSLEQASGVPMLLLLTYVFYDYAQRSAEGLRRTALVAGLALIVVYFLLTGLLGYRIPHESVDRVLRLAATVSAIVVGAAYWVILSGREPRWPWKI